MYIVKYHYKILFIFIIFNILISCTFQEPNKKHGIIYLENRSEKIKINTSNKNDVIRILGHPHTKSVDNTNKWIYIERILTKGEYHKLGQNILKTNNILLPEFNKYGIVNNKVFYDKNSINKLSFSEDETKNELTKKSFVENFLQSLKTKMYGKK